ncbi:MAG TPA: antibiotic biosynthesis monooxygenase [Chloroflexota bacterium]|nr:antibiotic biosynthesis monooxygenase [Chloroflexota bacterium]
MIVVSTRAAVTRDQEAEFAQRLYDRLGLVERYPGFARLEVLRPEAVVVDGQQVGGAAQYLVLTYWTDIAYFLAWTRSDDFRRAHAQRSSADPFAGPAAFEVHRLIQTTEGRGAPDGS